MQDFCLPVTISHGFLGDALTLCTQSPTMNQVIDQINAIPMVNAIQPNLATHWETTVLIFSTFPSFHNLLQLWEQAEKEVGANLHNLKRNTSFASQTQF